MAFKTKLEQNKPWALLRMSRRQYVGARPWIKGRMSRAKFEELLLLVPEELLAEMRDHATADLLIEQLFGKENASEK